MSLSRHSALNVGGSVSSMLIALVTIPLYMSRIGPERYGAMAVIWSLLAYFSFLDLGFGRAVAQRLSKLAGSRVERSRVLWTALCATTVLGLLGGFILWGVGIYVTGKVVSMSASARAEAQSAMIWLAFALPVLLSSTVLQGALQSRLRFAELNGIQLLTGALTQVGPLLLASLGYVELFYLVPATVAARVLGAVLMFRSCRTHVPLIGTPRVRRNHLTELFRYGGWVSVISILSPLLVTIDRLILASIAGAKSVPSYTVPYDLVSRSMVISGSVASALFPRLAGSTFDGAKELARRSTEVLVAVMTPVAVLGLIVSAPFLRVWMGSAFADGTTGVPEVILIGVWLNSAAIPHQSRLLARDNPKPVVFVYLFEVPIYLCLLWLAISKFGVLGAALAWTGRVMLDTGILLKLSDTLWHTVSRLLLPGAVVMAAALTSLSTSAQDPIRWVSGAVLLLLALAVGQAHLRSVWTSVISRVPASP